MNGTEDLAHYVARRARLSCHMLAGLKADLLSLGSEDARALIPVVEIIESHASEAYKACMAERDQQRLENRVQLLVDLQKLGKLGGPHAKRVASRLATSLEPSSGSHFAYQDPGDRTGATF